jgi:hypothetical protein
MHFSHGHAVDDPRDSASGPELGLEHQRVLPVSAPYLLHRASGLGRCDAPESVSLVAEHLGEARGGVKARQAQPVDRAVAAHERSGMRVSDHSVVLDAEAH